MELNQVNIKPKLPKIDELIAKQQSIILATLNSDGSPLSSYSPFVHLDGKFQIFVSYMSPHTLNLQERKQVSVMVIEDEENSKQIYVRNRLTLHCEATFIPKENPFYQLSIDALHQKHGKIIDVLQDLNDFVLFDIKPLGGSYVNGFASAYTVNADLSINVQVYGAHGQDKS